MQINLFGEVFKLIFKLVGALMSLVQRHPEINVDATPLSSTVRTSLPIFD